MAGLIFVVDAGQSRQQLAPAGEGVKEWVEVIQNGDQLWPLIPDQACGLAQADAVVRPAGDEEQPRLNDHGDQPGVEFDQLPYGMAGTMPVDQAVRLPQLEQPLDLPADTVQHHDLFPGETVLRTRRLPRINSRHSVVSDVRPGSATSRSRDLPKGGVNQHNYLTHFAGLYWVMWSDGPGVEDRVGQRVKFATSTDAETWTSPEFLTPIPRGSGPDSPHYGTRTEHGWRWIARGFWQREGELLALASLDEAAGFFGKSLALHAFRWEPTSRQWQAAGVIADNTINNFPPKKLRTGEWMLSRRPYDYKQSGVQFLVGGVEKIDQWTSHPVFGTAGQLKAEEPLWWSLPDGNLVALFRDNRRSGFLYRSFSINNGRTWSQPIKADFPDATSKTHGLRLADGRYVLVSNSNPKRRDPLTIAISSDGLVFDRLGSVVNGRHVDYPHVLEHDGHLLVAFAGGKQTVEVLKFPLDELDRIKNVAD